MTPFADPSATAWELSGRKVHIWLADLAALAAGSRQLEALLADDERERANRLRQPGHRGHFIAAHGVVRLLLARYLDAEPGRIQFMLDSNGKPRVESHAVPPAVSFNLSHSHGLALIGVTGGREIGVDIERVRPEVATEEIAERFFSRGETAALHALTPEARMEGFFACWTRKEAYLKARGDGISRGLGHFEVALRPGEMPAILHADDDPQAAARWSVLSLAPAPGYTGAAVVEGQDPEWRCWRWPG